MATGIGSIDKGVWTDMLWAGKALKLYSGREEVSMKVLKVDDKVIPAMPQRLGDHKGDLKALIKSIEAESMNYLKHSMVLQYNVTAVPLKPTVSKLEDPEFHAFLIESKDG